MPNNRIKVVGYATKQVYNGNIEYRNFSDDLTGLQLTSENSTFTFGNFAIKSTLDAKPNKIFVTNKFSNFVSLLDLDLTPEEANVLLKNNSEVKLNLDNRELSNYAYFGSAIDYIRVNLEDIITKWPASIYMTPVSGIYANKPTVENYQYNPIIDESTFKINVDSIQNPFSLNYLKNGSIINTFNEGNDIRNITTSYINYNLLHDSIEYPVLEFTGATNNSNDYIYLRVGGNPFMNITGNTSTTYYHIKPNTRQVETFFNSLPDFQNNLLNRLTTPMYSSTYRYSVVSEEDGNITKSTKSITWPVSDGYNIDFETTEYTTFVSNLIEMTTDLDESKSNLIVRFLTAESISDFDTAPRCDGAEIESAGQKMNRTLKIYGREYDEIKRYIDGLQYVNTVSYNKMDNTPDLILKHLAKTLGWGPISSVLENDLLKNYITPSETTFSGMSRGYTAIEAEIEMWRRIILNSPWIWKSKGARKAIEFLFKFIGAPDGLIEFNEFVYVAKNKIDVDLFSELLEENGYNGMDVTLFNVDPDGYPRVPNNNENMYFQKGGLWYRQTAGPESTIDILDGNNPHVGPYDGGAAFINQFNNLIPNFQPVTISSTTVTTNSVNLFENYQFGNINMYNGEFFIDTIDEFGVNLGSCVTVTPTKIEDPYPSASDVTDCGCELGEDDYALKLYVNCTTPDVEVNTCDKDIYRIELTEDGYMLFNYNNYDIYGNLIEGYKTRYTSTECCNSLGGTPIYKEEWSDGYGSTLINNGYVCCPLGGDCNCEISCDWDLVSDNINDMPIIQPQNSRFLLFKKPNNETTIIVPSSCGCIADYTIPVNVTDPISGEVGIGCMLTEQGLDDLNNTTYKYYLNEGIEGITVVMWIPIYDGLGNMTNSPPPNSVNSFIGTIYRSRANGLLPCQQYMCEN